MGAVQGAAVGLCDVGDVFGGFEAALDFEGGDAGAEEIGKDFQAGQVLRAEEVAAVAERDGLAVANEFVRKAAGLGAFAAIGGASAEGFASQALAGIGDAQGAMDKDFQGKGDTCDGLDFLYGTFAGQHDQRAAKGPRKFDACRARDGHLGGGVDGEIGREPANQAAYPDILHDGGIDSGGDQDAQVAFGAGQFVRED